MHDYRANRLLRDAIQESGTTVKTAAELSRVSRPTLSAWVNQTNRFNPAENATHRDILGRIIRALKLEESLFEAIMTASKTDGMVVRENRPSYNVDVSLAPILLNAIDDPNTPEATRQSAKRQILEWLSRLTS